MFIKQKNKFEKIISPEKLYAAFSNRVTESDKINYQVLNNIKKDIKKVVRNNFKIKNTESYNYLELSDIERIEKVKNLYKKIGQSIIQILKKEYQHDDKVYNELRKRILTKINNKIRTDTSGKVFIIINNQKYFGDIEGYEKMFVNSKLKFKNLFKSIVKELINTLENDTKELGKTFLINNKTKNLY